MNLTEPIEVGVGFCWVLELDDMIARPAIVGEQIPEDIGESFEVTGSGRVKACSVFGLYDVVYWNIDMFESIGVMNEIEEECFVGCWIDGFHNTHIGKSWHCA